MWVIGLVVLFIGVVLVICYPINKNKNNRCTAETEGVLENIQARFNSKGVQKPMHIYSYEVDGVRYELKTLDYSPQVAYVGDSCTIWFNPDKPEDAQAYRGSDKYLKTLLYIGLAMIPLGILLTIVGAVV